VVAKEAVPVERVRLATDTVTEDAAVNETIRKEHIEAPGAEGNPRDAGR
jgi:stress response protein YsnF